MKEGRFHGVDFYAHLTRKGGSIAGTISIVSRSHFNGKCRAAISVPRNSCSRVLPVVTWVSPAFLQNKCVLISEEQARAIDSHTMGHVDAYENSAEYRAAYAIEARNPNASPLQRALPEHFAPNVGNSTAKFYEIYGQ